ncbi:Ig-like domain-containing protein [Marinicella sp. S1101]|uniref:choice-of-anchor Q domain-containing protein n=1 Tax=Marinicella marina TaxID=2996016 RepID=UPI0022609FD9|nr:Ig-like domain-containing protein [Marinicella marina]MCX7553684.1 Ig-like domain-containing protein [Marinicella marina]MDJ1140774.1 Ig-like domain-containing protein [Marinicella marina]
MLKLFKTITFAHAVILSLTWALPGQTATITINSSALIAASADDGLCTLGEAVDAANNNTPSGAVLGECAAGEAHPIIDVITFDTAILPTTFNTVTELVLAESVIINGPSKELVTFTGIAQNRVFKVFNNLADQTFIIRDVSFDSSSIRATSEFYGAAIWGQHYNGSSLRINRVNFIGNNAELGGGALALFGGFDNSTVINNSYFADNFVYAESSGNAGGGAIFIGANQQVDIKNSTFERNTATNLPGLQNPLDDAAGGAILIRANGVGFESVVNIEQSTFSDNIADGVGGALAMGGPGYPNEISEVTVKHSTIVSNESDFNSDQTGNDSGGGGIYSSSSIPVNLFNTIVAANSDNSQDPAPDLAGAIISTGYNLIGNNESSANAFPVGQPNINDDWVGGIPILIIPLLSPLADNGGITPTRLPLNNSLAIDNGKCNIIESDQRQQHNPETNLRTIDQPDVPNALTGCDIGAVELGTSPANEAPNAIDDDYDLLEGEVLLQTPQSGLLANDVDGDTLWVISAGSFNSSGDVGVVELLADGAFEFTPFDTDANGLTTFEYSISDRINDASAVVTLNIEPVNDAPQFDVNSNVLVGTPSQYVTLSWASNLTPGPSNESDQTLVFVTQILSAPTGFFAGFPSIDSATGEISFELAADASGQAELSISLRDNGGTSNGGQDTSPPVLLTIATSDIIFADGFDTQANRNIR